MLALLWFPFRFAARSPMAVLGYLTLICLADVAFQLAAAALGYDPLYKEELTGLDDVGAHALRMAQFATAETLVAGLAVAPLVVATMRHLNLRERHFEFQDAVLFAVVSMALSMVRGLVEAGARFAYVSAEFWVEDITTSRGISWHDLALPCLAVVATYFYARLWVIGPAALRNRNFGVTAAWMATRKRVWQSLIYAAALVLVTRSAWAVYKWGRSYLPEPPYAGSLTEALQPLAMAHIGLDALVGAVLSVFYSCVLVFAFAKLAGAPGVGR